MTFLPAALSANVQLKLPKNYLLTKAISPFSLSSSILVFCRFKKQDINLCVIRVRQYSYDSGVTKKSEKESLKRLIWLSVMIFTWRQCWLIDRFPLLGNVKLEVTRAESTTLSRVITPKRKILHLLSALHKSWLKVKLYFLVICPCENRWMVDDVVSVWKPGWHSAVWMMQQISRSEESLRWLVISPRAKLSISPHVGGKFPMFWAKKLGFNRIR